MGEPVSPFNPVTRAATGAGHPAARGTAFLVGSRYAHHARHSGYEAFGKFVGTPLEPPVRFRWTKGRWGWPLNRAVSALARHSWYSVGAAITELAVLAHAARHRRCLYHALYGDSDLALLPGLVGLTRNALIATFHQPSSLLGGMPSIRRIARRLDGVVLVAECQRELFERWLPSDRVFVVLHGVDADFFVPAASPATVPAGVTVGSHLRDFPTLAAAMNRAIEVEPALRLTAVGTRSDKGASLQSCAPRGTRFLERLSDEELRGEYQSARFAVFAFEEATANNSVLEAMACGLPVIATDVGGVGEYVVEGTGVLCRPGSADDLAEAMLALARDPSGARRMGQAARERARALGFEVAARAMAQVYDRVLGSA